MTTESAGCRQNSETTMAHTPSAPGRCRGPQTRPGVIRWQCAQRMKKTIRSPTRRSGIQAGTSGIASRGRTSSWEMLAEGRTIMRNRVRAIFLVMSSLAMAVGLVYADLKKGYYSPAQLGSAQQAAPIELLPDSNYQVAAFPVPAVDLAPGDGLPDVQIYCNTCHSPRYITMQPPLPAATWESEVNKMNKTFGAGIPEENARIIFLYLQAHYTAENRKR